MDRERIGIWGSSYGGHALTVAAIDKRVKCVVSQVPTTSGFLAAQRRVRDKAQVLQAAFEADREARDAGSRPPCCAWSMPIRGAGGVSGPDSHAYMTGEAQRCPPGSTRSRCGPWTGPRLRAAAYIRRIAPRPC